MGNNGGSVNVTSITQAITVPAGGGAMGIGLDFFAANITTWTNITIYSTNRFYLVGHTISTGSVSTVLSVNILNPLQLSLASWGP